MAKKKAKESDSPNGANSISNMDDLQKMMKKLVKIQQPVKVYDEASVEKNRDAITPLMIEEYDMAGEGMKVMVVKLPMI